MNIIIKNKSKEYVLNIENVTQLLGRNFYVKNYITQSLQKHFSKSKYLEFEEQMISNIYISDETIGREYFLLNNISSRNSLIDALKISSKSIFMMYLQKTIIDINVSKEIDEIDKQLIFVYEKINEKLSQDNIKLLVDYTIENLISLVSNSETLNQDENDINYCSNYELVLNYVKVVMKLYANISDKIMILFENIDHMLNINEYKKIIDYIIDNCYSNIYFVFSSSVKGYAYAREEVLKGINVINEEIFNAPSYEKIKFFLGETYPNISYEEVEDNKLIEELELILQDIGTKENKLELKAKVIKNLINKALLIEDSEILPLNDSENAFICHRTVI